MEYGLRHLARELEMSEIEVSLNPCCNGIWSQTLRIFHKEKGYHVVLILVVMEYGLRHEALKDKQGYTVLILVVMEYGLRPA